MSEGIAVHGDDVHLVFESGASHYAESDVKPDNVIKDLHRSPLADLARLPQ
jgi:hypothetical protein